MIEWILTYWKLLSPVVIGIGTLFTWWYRTRFRIKKEGLSHRLDSDKVIIDRMEKLKVKLAILLDERVEDMQKNTELQRTINRLKLECPDCVEKILRVIESENLKT